MIKKGKYKIGSIIIKNKLKYKKTKNNKYRNLNFCIKKKLIFKY